MAISRNMLSSNHSLWETPQHLYDDLNAEFKFDLDPCAEIDTAKCDVFFTPVEDGLALPWFGRVFMNPPYGKTLGQWMAKALEEVRIGNAELVVALVPARTDTKWWHAYCIQAEVRFIKGRLRFSGNKHNAPFPSAIVIFR